MKKFSNILSTTVTPCLSSFGSFSLFNLFCHHWKKSTFYWSWLTFGSQGMDIMDWFCGIWAQFTKWETLSQIYKKWFGYTEVSKKPSKLKWISFWVGSWLQLDWVGALIYILRVNIFQDEYFSEVNTFQRWIFHRVEYILGGDIFRGEYFSGVNILRKKFQPTFFQLKIFHLFIIIFWVQLCVNLTFFHLSFAQWNVV